MKKMRIVAALGLGAAALLLGGPARADSSSLGGYNISADGNAVDIVYDNATGLAGIHPFTEADFPEAQSSFQTGPFGSGLATVFWPGAAGGNFGSLSTQLGFPDQLQPIASQLNDPMRANAQYPAGPATSSYPPGAPGGAVDMGSTADQNGVTATADLAGQSAASVLTFTGAHGASSAKATDKAVGTAESDVDHVQLAGGLIDIGSIQSTATATSDGNTASGSATTTVQGITVLGQPASLGANGLVLPNFASSLGPVTGGVVQTAVSQTFSALGLTVTELPATHSASGASATAASGAVAITIVPPSSAAPILEQAASALAPIFPAQAAIIPTLPGLLQGASLTITLGRASVSSNASPSFDNSFNAAAAAPAATDSGSGGTGSADAGSGAVVAGDGGSAAAGAAASGVAPALADGGAAGGSAGSTSSGSSTPSARAPSTGPSADLPTTLVNLSKPVGAGVAFLAAMLAAGCGFGLWRVARMLLPTDSGPVCPLGQDAP